MRLSTMFSEIALAMSGATEGLPTVDVVYYWPLKAAFANIAFYLGKTTYFDKT